MPIFSMKRIVMCIAISLLSFQFTYSGNIKLRDIADTAIEMREVHEVKQKLTITGRVVEKDGFPLPGVSITVKGKLGVGVTTDLEGMYSIECNAEDILIFSYVGFRNKEEKAGTLNNVTVTLEDDTIALEEFEIVAFGKQKKESVISSISTVTPKELRVPSSNITTAFAGRMAGVIAYQRSGEPGLDNAEFFIRGITTFSSYGKKNPLILIDGIEMNATDLARLNVDDIASFSVMKDANAAALYGARGANGVILVATKEGTSDKIAINVRAELSSSANTELVELADPITFMRLQNEATRTRDAMVMLPNTSSKIRETELGANSLMYPAVDWYDYMIKDRTFNQRVNLNMTGGGKAVQYYLAANYQHDTGIIKESSENMINNNIDVNRLQVRSNVTIRFTPTTSAIIRAYGSFDDSSGPKDGGADVFQMVRNANPVRFLPFYPPDEANKEAKHILFGMDAVDNFTNPLAQVMSSYKESSSSMMLMQMEFDHKFSNYLNGAYAKALFNIKRDAYYDMTRSYNPFYYALAQTVDGSYALNPLNPTEGTEYLDFKSGKRTVTSSLYGEVRLGYDKKIDDVHDFNTLLVGSLRSETSAADLSLTSSQRLQASLPLRNVSTAGRFAYGYDSRYFFEFNFGYNGSERFSKKYRFGFFPSIGAGWMVSNEDFMSGVNDVLTTLKLKGTYGKVGNDQIGSSTDRFFYISQIEMNSGGYTFGTEKKYSVSGINIARYANELITWEIAKKMNLGVEIGLFDDLTVLADYFQETRENVLQTRADIPTTMGLKSTPQANVGVGQGRGFEVELKYQKNFSKDFWTVINGNFTYATSEYKEYEEADYSDVPWRSHIGQKINQNYGYIAERLFIDEEDVNNSPKQLIGGEYMAGDIKYKDINNDGQIDSDDIVPLGYPSVPEVIYGIGFSVGYKNFDLSCFFQGSARSSFLISPSRITPFINNGQRGLLRYIADDHWSENNRNIYAFWPRLSTTEITNNSAASTWWLRDGSFLRFKTAEVGYTLPEKFTKKFKVNMLRFYASGSNLFIWSKFKMWDPEMGDNGLGYPIQRVFNIGVNINL